VHLCNLLLSGRQTFHAVQLVLNLCQVQACEVHIHVEAPAWDADGMATHLCSRCKPSLKLAAYKHNKMCIRI
jgi:hypothetical protein